MLNLSAGKGQLTPHCSGLHALWPAVQVILAAWLASDAGCSGACWTTSFIYLFAVENRANLISTVYGCLLEEGRWVLAKMETGCW